MGRAFFVAFSLIFFHHPLTSTTMKTYVIPLLSLLLTTGCKKEKTELERLPPATQEGKNTAGFLLDGKAWTPSLSYTDYGSPVGALWIKTSVGRTLRLSFARSDKEGNNRTSWSCFLPHIVGRGHFTFNQEFSSNTGDRNPAYAVYSQLRPNPKRRFITGPDAQGSLTITRFDTVAHIVAGTFEIKVQEDGGTETHELTQGRFDLSF